MDIRDHNFSVMNFDLSDEQRIYLDQLDSVCRGIRDYETSCYLNERINDQIVPRFREIGMLGLPISTRYGGQGADHLTYALALERIGMEGSSMRTFFSAHISIGQMVIQNWGTDEQKRAYLPKTTQGKEIMAFALTEPAGGSDPSSMQTRFEENGHFIIKGRKHWISNASTATVITTYAKSSDGKISAFIVPSDAKGYRASRFKHKMGMGSSDTGEIIFDDCIIPKENLLGVKGKGLSVAYSALMDGRLSVAAGAVGVMQDCLYEAIEYSKARKQFGESLAKKQLIQEHIAEIAIKIESTRWLVYRAALMRQKLHEYINTLRESDEWMERIGKDQEYITLRNLTDRVIAIAKYHAANAAFDVANRSVQILGSTGYSKESRAARHMLDSRALTILEGANEVLKLKIASNILGDQYRAY